MAFPSHASGITVGTRRFPALAFATDPAPTVIALALLLTVAGIPQDAAPTRETPPEYGLVRWSRRLETALASAAQSHKPVLLVFQEVPG